MQAQSWSNSDLASCLCWDTETGDWCQDDFWDQCSSYVTDLWPQMMTGAVTIVFIFCVAMVYVVARIMSCIKSTVTLCCLKEQRTNGAPVYWYRGFMLVTLGLYCVFAGVLTGYHGGAVSDGLDALNATLTAGTDAMNMRADAFAGGALPLAQELSVEEDVAPLVSAVLDDVSRWTTDIGKVQGDIFRNMWTVDFFLWILPIFFAGLLGFALLNVHRVAPEVFFFFIAMIATALCYFQANLAVGGAVTNDLCTDFVGVSQQMGLIMQSKLKCGSIDGSLGEIPQTVGLLEAAYAEMAGNESGSVTGLCTSYFVCAPVEEYSTLAEFANVFYNASQLYTGSSACTGCTIAECAGACSAGSPAQAASVAALAFFEKVDEGVASLVAAGYPLANCSVYQAIVADSHRPICEGSKALSDTLPVFAGVAIGCAVLAAVMVFLNVLANYLYTTPPAAEYAAINDGVWKVYTTANNIPLVKTTKATPSGYGACNNQLTGAVTPKTADPTDDLPEVESVSTQPTQ